MVIYSTVARVVDAILVLPEGVYDGFTLGSTIIKLMGDAYKAQVPMEEQTVAKWDSNIFLKSVYRQDRNIGNLSRCCSIE